MFILIIILLIFIFLVATAYLPEFFHHYKFKILWKNHAHYYSKLTPQNITDIFIHQSYYTRVWAINFFIKYNVENSAAFLYNQINSKDWSTKHPRGTILPFSLISSAPMPIIDVNQQLSLLLSEKPLFFNDIQDKKTQLYEYWKPIIQKHINYTITPLQ